MSDPVIKGAKRSSSRPAPHAAPKSSAKSRKLTDAAAKPKPKRAAAEKAPVRKAAPATKSSSTSKSSKSQRPAARQTPASKQSKRPAAKPAPAKKAAGKAQEVAPSGRGTAAGSGKKGAPPPRPQPGKESAQKASKAATTKTAPAAHKSAPPPKAPPRHAPAPPRQPSRDEAAALKAFERAHKDFTRGNFAAARDHFRALIEQHAGVSEVAARARTYLNIAETRLRAEAPPPRDPDSLYDRGVIELNRGDFVAAQELFERALKRDPDAADTHYALAAARARLGSVESALQALERAVELKPVLRVRAQADADLALLRNDPEFERIVFPNTRP
jgi:tetratricopeptide (TPR) repeat protein